MMNKIHSKSLHVHSPSDYVFREMLCSLHVCIKCVEMTFKQLIPK